jgi:hypothetical protein
MGKVLLALLLAIAAWLLLKAAIRKNSGSPRMDAARDKPVERILKCGRCGLFLPESETRSLDGEIACRDPQRCPRRETA